MRILIVSSYLPFPLHDGGSVRLYNIIKQLSKRHKITLVCEIREHQSEKDIDELKNFCEEVHVVVHRKPWTPQNIAKSIFSIFPILLVMHTSQEMKLRIFELLNRKQFDVIHIETFYVNQNLPKTYLPTVLVEHNIEYKVYERFAHASIPLLRQLLMVDILKIKYWEEYFWKKATRVVAVSKKEQREMKGIHALLVPNGVDTEQFKMKNGKLKLNSKEKRILFIGNFKWVQNQKAAIKILRDIWPIVESRMVNQELRNVKLWIVGKNISESIKRYQSKTVMIDENAPDETEKIYQRSDILLAPIEVGGGSSYKILEAMSSGIPVVTTELGAKGIDAKAGEIVLVGKTDSELAESVIQLLSNTSTYEKMSKKARIFVESEYAWEGISQKLENAYKEAIIAAL